jgi:hypothetical protein
VRLHRLKAGLGWSIVIAAIGDQTIRAGLSHGASDGLNILLFLALGAAVYYPMRSSIRRGDPASFAWRGRSPWLWLFWIPAAALTVLLSVRFW